MIAYSRANTDWLADCAVGISVHWTAQTAPREGAAREFADAVARFRLEDFLAAVERSGAEYVIFTVAHGLQKLPCPHPVVESILPGRTVERDLLGELARELARRNKKLIVYYNHSCNQGDDPEWEQAVGYHEPSSSGWRKTCAGSCAGWESATASSSVATGSTAPIRWTRAVRTTR